MKILSRSLFFFEEEQNLSKNGIIVNEWENLTALSNRR
ncbi:replication protein, partial [Enterococcus faecium]